MIKVYAYVVYDQYTRKIYRTPESYIKTWANCHAFMHKILENNKDIKPEDLCQISLGFRVKEDQNKVVVNKKNDEEFVKSIGNDLTMEDVKTYSMMDGKEI
jgi:hypothetical protein